jgi:CxxC motif-containing protein (DUF1111 family)
VESELSQEPSVRGRSGIRAAIVFGQVLCALQAAGSDVILTLLDGGKNPIAGVSCSQEGGPSGVSDETGKVSLHGMVSIGDAIPMRKAAWGSALSRIPLAPGEKASITLFDTRGRKAMERSIGPGERVSLKLPGRGLYFADVSAPGYPMRGPLVQMGSEAIFEGIPSAPAWAAMAAAKGTAATANGPAAVVCSKPGFVTQVFRVSDGDRLTVDFSAPRLAPLYDASTRLEPEVRYDRGDAVITQWGDRARDRHAREDRFQSYDHYLTHYWEHRTARTILTDRVAKGGDGIDVSWVTEWKLDTLPEFRAWYSGKGSEAQYYGNYAPLFKREGPGTYDKDHNRIGDQGTQYKYTYTIKTAWTLDGREVPLAVGQFMEIEASQFLDAPPEGRDNYYGTVFLYEVGNGGMVPWYTVGDHADQASERENSRKLDEKAWLGGRTTLPYQYSDEPDNHFMQMATNLSGVNAQPFVQGRRVLHTDFIDGAHDEPGNPPWAENAGKAGPRYINVTCNSCHVRNGRGATAVPGKPLYNMVVKVGDESGGPHPKLGSVLQPRSTGADAEGYAALRAWIESDGLRRPEYAFEGGPVPARYSVRATPQLVGMGLLEAVPEAAVQALEDPEDADGDGISGRANIVLDPKTGEPRLGRFGWKAGKADLAHQIAGAFNTDMGVMTSLMPKPDCGSEQTGCAPSGGALADSSLRNLIAYVSLLGVRARRDLQDPAALKGEALFASAGCAACHIPALKTGPYHPKAELRNQTIHPYTDLLLHDMGPGLADNLPEGLAGGAEWRTPPLWGIGLSPCVTGGVAGPFQKQVCSPDANYLHDGRARTLEEAILWHGGEGAAAAAEFRAMSPDESAALIRFLRTL